MAQQSFTPRSSWLLAVISAFGLCAALGCNTQSSEADKDSKPNRYRTVASTDAENQARLAEAKRLLELKLYTKSLELSQQVLSSEPDNQIAAFIAAQCLSARGKYREASDVAEIVSDKHPQLGAAALFLKVNLAVEQKRLDVAERHLRRIIELYGPVPQALHQLVKLLNDQGRRFEASQYILQLARNGYAEPLELLAMGTLSEPFHDDLRLQDADTQGTVTPSDLADAKSLFVQDKLQECRELTGQLLDRYQDRPAIYAFAGRLYAYAFDEERLKAWSLKSTDAGRNEPDYWHAMGLWMRNEGRHAEAIRCFAENVERDATDIQGYLYLGQALAGAGEDKLADRVTQRCEALRRVAHLFYVINFENGGSKEFRELADLLDELYRPWEAFGWRIADANQSNAMSAFAATAKAQAARANQREKDKPPLFNTCGIDKTKWPLPEECKDNWKPTSSSNPKELSSQTTKDFLLVDIANDAKLDFQYHNNNDPDPSHLRMPDVSGGGIACVDYDLDGYTDLYFGQAGGTVYDANDSMPNQLYRIEMESDLRMSVNLLKRMIEALGWEFLLQI